MSQYENEFSDFPKKLITKHNFKNIDDSIASIINQINNLRSQGLYTQASLIIDNNKDILSQLREGEYPISNSISIGDRRFHFCSPQYH